MHFATQNYQRMNLPLFDHRLTVQYQNQTHTGDSSKKTLYGLRRSPRHWFHLIAKQLRDIGLRQTKHDDCLFVGSLIPGQPPLYLGIYVDDLIYFSADPEVEKQF